MKKTALKITVILFLTTILNHCTNRKIDVDKTIRDPSELNNSIIQITPMVPDAVKLLITEADSFLSHGDISQAILTLKRALSISPGSALVQQYLAEAYLTESNYQQAMHWSSMVIEKGPDHGSICERSRRTQALAAELLNQVTVQAKALEAIASCTQESQPRY